MQVMKRKIRKVMATEPKRELKRLALDFKERILMVFVAKDEQMSQKGEGEGLDQRDE